MNSYDLTDQFTEVIDNSYGLTDRGIWSNIFKVSNELSDYEYRDSIPGLLLNLITEVKYLKIRVNELESKVDES